MNRKTIVASLFEDITTFGRLAFRKAYTDRSTHMQSRTKIGILFTLSNDGPQSLKEFADRFHVSSSAVTQIIDELERDGCVVRKDDKADRRRIFVSITKKGVAELAIAKRAKFADLAKILDVLSDDELMQLRVIEQKLVTRLEELCGRHTEEKGIS